MCNKDENLLRELRSSLIFKSSHSEVKLTVASFLSDRVVDEILDALSHCHHKLVSFLLVDI